MVAKAILVLCAQALFIQSAFSQCLGRAAPCGLAGRGWGYDRLGYGGLGLGGLGWGGCGGPALGITATTGGGLPVSSGSCVPPVGVSVASENVYEGILAAAGELPFVGTVGVEGVLPTAGAGAVNYGCGNGVTAMAADAGIGYGYGGIGYDGLGYGGIGYDGLGYGGYGYGGLGYAGIGYDGLGYAGLGYDAGIAGPLGYGAGLAGCGCGGIL